MHADADIESGVVCSCGERAVQIQCHDCTEFAATCSQCFVSQHLNNPFHWAQKWDPLQGFFVKHDISRLGHIIQLGHHGRPCPSSTGSRKFITVDHNGVHATELAFCGCHENPPNMVRQLMRARLFPATVTQPKTAFTFTVLDECHFHNLEAKKAAYDYMGALRRLTDNAFTSDVPDPYENFLRAMRVWNYLDLLESSGQMHGIDLLLPHRPEGNLVLYCPACPEPGFNTDPAVSATPLSLRHLNQSQRTLDGNFQCNQFSKNSDPDDVSLCKGKGQFPLDSEYKEYLRRIPISKEKSTCNYLKAVNKQDKKKFKNMAITGTVNCQCSHVFILTSVDLQFGERFANSDYALATCLRQHNGCGDMSFEFRMEVSDVDEVLTYDIACEYVVYIESRFQKYFPDVLDKVKKMRWGVPALHIQGHQESCMYEFGTAYLSCVGHFHGETAEQYWPEANQLGPHVRQMNNGHRQDTLIYHSNDWNFKKLADIGNLGAYLAEELALGRRKFLEKLNHFRALSAAAGDAVEKWKLLDRTSRKVGKDVFSVYRHNTSKVPSQLAIYQHMLAQDDNFVATLVPKNRIARFMNEALDIEEAQRKIKRTVKEATEQDLQSRTSEITKRRRKLEARLGPWRSEQRAIMPMVGDKVALQATARCLVEDEKLYLPSDLTPEERQEFQLVALGFEEARWREGQAFDALRATRGIVKGLRALEDHKFQHSRQQKQNSRSGDQIEDGVRRRDFHMATYEIARQAMITLGTLSSGTDSSFPPLSIADTFMKSVLKKRQLGDSHLTDGQLFRMGAGSADTSLPQPSASSAPPAFEQGSSTQMSKRKTETLKKSEERKEGWLWRELGKMGKLSSEEMQAWSEEAERVQWFRAEAEVQRWQEHAEMRLAELLRTIRSFEKWNNVWLDLAKAQSSSPGLAAYARQTAATYCLRRERCEKLIIKAGYGALLEPGASLVDFVVGERAKEPLY
ncbi:hypothetical protein B0H11DRAFT_1754208 [Mycena galericulata]|nr:hypothetical protein B0H11DRAFT_1754208 [Mycena galericulata]